MDVKLTKPLPDDVDELKRIITKQQQMLLDKETLIDRMQVLLERFKQRRFGPSSEVPVHAIFWALSGK